MTANIERLVNDILEVFRTRPWLKPARGTWLQYGEGLRCCGLTAPFIAAKGEAAVSPHTAYLDVPEWVACQYGLGNMFVLGFIEGFDDTFRVPLSFRTAERQAGYETGKRVARQVFGEGD